MSRPVVIWIAFGLCLAVVLAAMGWVSLTMLRLDRAEGEARRQAAVEENVRLALWRMDSAVAPLLARENARPYFAYSSFYAPQRAYTRMLAEIGEDEVLLPSAILTDAPEYILVHFQIGPDGTVTSPQAPTGNNLDVAEEWFTTGDSIDAFAARLAEVKPLLNRETLLARLPRATTLPSASVRRSFLQQGPQGQGQPAPDAPVGQRQSDQQKQSVQPPQVVRNTAEYQARFRRQLEEQQKGAGVFANPSADVREAPMQPLWVGEALVLARQVRINGKAYVQGCRLDWPGIRGWLLAEAADLLPAADLNPAHGDAGVEQSRMLAALPARLSPGQAPASAATFPTPIHYSLMVAWGCVLLAAAAVGFLLRGAVVLSERRGAFVSAVTHELRTPLTTFRMYTEMLAEGMVTEEENRLRYLTTLQAEAERLSHLVENVLAYARLERGRPVTRQETVPLGELLGRLASRLVARAEHADMTLTLDVSETSRGCPVRVDAGVVEQILFNLVDNACKYAASADDRRIQVEAGRAGSMMAVRVRDHGPGVAAHEAKRLFRPFRKSASDAARSAPGVGLGLALSRRLARRLGGDLRLDGTPLGQGACFVLTLPCE